MGTKWTPRKGEHRQYAAASRIAREDPEVTKYIYDDPNCKGHSVHATGISEVGPIKDLVEHHKELSGYIEHPEQVYCVFVERLLKDPAKNKEVMRVYVDIENWKVVAKDLLKWDSGSASGPAHLTKV